MDASLDFSVLEALILIIVASNFIFFDYFMVQLSVCRMFPACFSSPTMFTSQALSYVHRKKLVHSDIKPPNLLLSTPNQDATLKVADFGVCFEHMRGGGWAGTVPYLPASVLSGKKDATLVIDAGPHFAAFIAVLFLVVVPRV